MLLALMIVSGLFALLVGGKALLAGLTMFPVIGPAIGWYADLVQPLTPGITEQLICGGMAVQVIVIILSVPLYLPGVIRRGITVYRARAAA